ncbi:hypothetical protein BDP27DRAFT_650703 [Rhodocollybia butyracea]|uniref:BTB domain-containing protein n=1 Tax=Rhodocollybia butyracea TaxID=206335 RepID=A0A9P5TX72_9AGAR|nr:hypothetical protein BDP27DRAFT_650703 [Rhodocollybia butyracea]
MSSQSNNNQAASDSATGLEPFTFLESILPNAENQVLNKAAEPTLRDDTFYYHFRVFKVDGYMFQIPLVVFAAESPIFRDMLEFPVSSTQEPEGSSDSNPICLDGILREDFRQLLRVLGPPTTFNLQPPNLSFNEWVSVLKLADLWCMDAVKKHAMSTMCGLPDVDPVEKIVVARRYGIRSWLSPAFNAILRCDESLSERHLERLGAPTFFCLIRLRDRLEPRYKEPGSNTVINSAKVAKAAKAAMVDKNWRLGTSREAVSVDFTQAIEEELPDFQRTRRQDWQHSS